MSADRTPTSPDLFPYRRLFPQLACVLWALAGCAGDPPPRSVLQSTTERFANGWPDAPTPVADLAGLPNADLPDKTSIPAIGAAEPVVVVSLFTDYQCPNCRRSHDIAQRLVDRWPDSVQVQFRHLPLASHPLAVPAAVAAQAAHRQGRFMCLHTALTKTRPLWTALDLLGFRAFVADILVPRCRLDAAAFGRDIDDPSLLAYIVEERERVRDMNVTEVPKVLVNGLEADPFPRPGHPPARLVNSLVRRELRDAQAPGRSPSNCPASDSACQVSERILANTGDAYLTRLILGGLR